MYDKVKLFIDRCDIGEQYPNIASLLDEAIEQTDLKTGEVKTYGGMDGLKVSVFVSGLSIVGSLPKFLYGGSNIYPLDRHTTAQAIEKLGDALHIKADGARVVGIEFGSTFLMRHGITEYLARLGDMPKLSRCHFEQATLYYRGVGKQHPKVFAFYDKRADAETKGMECPDGLRGANLLRYEMRLSGRLPQQLKVPMVTASTLYDNSFYRLMVNLYQDSYFSISKLNQVKTNIMSEIKTVRDAYDVFVARLISQSDHNQIRGFLDELKEAGVFADRKNYTRLKNKIQEVATKADITVSDELIRELDDEIRNCGAYV